MRYEVCEKKYYKISDIVKINNFSYELKHIETTFDQEKYNLEISLNYVDSFLEEKSKEITLPIELATTMTEQLTAKINNLDIKIVKNNGVDIDISFDIEVFKIEEEKEEIKEIYQQELEEKLEHQRVDEVIIEEEKMEIIVIEEETKSNFLDNLKSDYAKYKVLTLEDSSLDKISAKYNLSINFLYDAKKANNKVIVHDKE